MFEFTSRRRPGRCSRAGFTLIELLVVVAIISLLSGLLFPVFFRAREAARQRLRDQEREKTGQTAAASAPSRPAEPPTGAPPIIDSLELRMTLEPSYHRIGVDVYTRYRLDCAGRIVFRHPGGDAGEPVLLTVPFPANTVEARDVELTLTQPGHAGRAEALPASAMLFDLTGIHSSCAAAPGTPVTANVRFVAFGRDQFDYALPPARQIRSVAVTLKLAGASTRVVPDDSLQPSSTGPDELRWEFKSLVSNRQISVQIPAAQTPVARMLLLLRLMAVAVLFFGAGFWYLSERAKPGQLDHFRWGHFLLLALTYSLFFVIFAVLEFHGTLGTPLAMTVSAVLSLPLLVLHVSRVLDYRFAAGRVVPLAVFTLGLVINGVYGGELRDYVFIGAAALLMAYVTLDYQSWAGGREQHRLEKSAEYAGRRRSFADGLAELGRQLAELNLADSQAAELLSAAQGSAPSAAAMAMRGRLERAREPVSELREGFESLGKRLRSLPAEQGWDTRELCTRFEREAAGLQENLQSQLGLLMTELEAYREATKPVPESTAGLENHCAACGKAVPRAPFCPHCGCVSAREHGCAGCGERIVIPMHLLGEARPAEPLCCTRCGTPVPGRA